MDEGMPSNLSRYRNDLSRLRNTGEKMSGDLTLRRPAEGQKLTPDLAELKETLDGTFEREYQRWYTEACAVLRQIP
jgi:hypothetical protein